MLLLQLNGPPMNSFSYWTWCLLNVCADKKRHAGCEDVGVVNPVLTIVKDILYKEFLSVF
jgi:hypothetical protein